MKTSFGFDRVFDVTFLSHEIGCLKPDRDVFEHVAAQLGVPAGRIAFVDDNLVNVEGALSCGFAAKQAKGTREAKAALADLGVFGAPRYP